jgi:DNA-binding NarL/FixJ family response regulator
MKIRLLVVDDHPVLRIGLTMAVRAIDDIEVVADASVAEAPAAIERTNPSVVVFGLHPPTGDAVSAATALIGPQRRVVVLDEAEDPKMMLRALDSGFAAYVAKSRTTAEIVSTIRHAEVCPGAFAAPGLADAVRAGQERESLLSARERQVLLLLHEGFSGTEIASRLGVSGSSVKTYVNRIYGKLDVSNRSQAILAALGRGLLPLPDAA